MTRQIVIQMAIFLILIGNYEKRNYEKRKHGVNDNYYIHLSIRLISQHFRDDYVIDTLFQWKLHDSKKDKK